MRRLLLPVVFVLAVGCEKKSETHTSAPPAASAPKVAEAPPSKIGWTELDPKAPIAATLATEAAAALDAGKKPYAYLHAEWCPPCKAIEATRATDERMVKAFAGTHIISIDVDSADAAQLDALQLHSESIPVFFRLERDGHPTGARIDGGAWGDNIPENMAPPLAAFFAN